MVWSIRSRKFSSARTRSVSMWNRELSLPRPRQRAQLGMQRIGNLETFQARAGRRLLAARPGQPHAFIGEHLRRHVLQPRIVGIRAGERTGIDREDGVADARMIAGLEKRIVLV